MENVEFSKPNPIEIKSRDLIENEHCFVRLEHLNKPMFASITNTNVTRSFAQIMWNARGTDYIEGMMFGIMTNLFRKCKKM